jgi:hypothetical protein
MGLALDGVVKWLAYQAVPAECPNCSHNLRPPFPVLPWFRRSGAEYRPLFANDEEARYRDEEEGPDTTQQPAAVEVSQVTKKDKKGKAISAAAEESGPWAA